MSDRPAILGNDPLFKNLIPIAKPTLPGLDVLAPEFGQILASGILSKGHHRSDFEALVARHLGVTHAIAVSSCTSGLMLTYQALQLTGEVIVPSFTFMATVSALRWAGLRPVFADVNEATTNLDPSAAEAAITSQTQAIVAVHNFGSPADIDALQDLADQYRLRLVFDAAHAFGSLYQSAPVGAQGDAQVFSLSPTKLLVAGEGGIVATNDDEIAERIRIGREFGNCGDYDSNFPGINARLTELSAVLGKHGLPLLEASARERNCIAELYRRLLSDLPGIGFQEIRNGNRSSYKDFSIRIDAEAFGLTRDELHAMLAAENVETRKYYDPPVHRQMAYKSFVRPEISLANTDRLALATLNLPVWSKMEETVISDICLAIARAHRFRDEIKAELRRSGRAKSN